MYLFDIHLNSAVESFPLIELVVIFLFLYNLIMH